MCMYNEVSYLISVISLFITEYYEDNNKSTFLKFRMIPEAWVNSSEVGLTCTMVLKTCIAIVMLQIWEVSKDVLIFQGKQRIYIKWWQHAHFKTKSDLNVQ